MAKEVVSLSVLYCCRDKKIILFSKACLIAFTEISVSSPGDFISMGIEYLSSIIIASARS